MNLTALSLGAGVQSTTIALLSIEGRLPKPDVAIFADTGWRDRQVDLLDVIEDGDPDGCSPYGCRSGAPVEPTTEMSA